MLEDSHYIIRAYRSLDMHRHPDGDMDVTATPFIEITHYIESEFDDLKEIYSEIEEFRSPWAMVFNWDEETIGLHVEHPSEPHFISKCPRSMMLSVYEGVTQAGGIFVVVFLGDPDVPPQERENLLQAVISTENVYYVDTRETAAEEARLWMSRN